nr:truncated hydroxymethylbilane synthase housekeeping form 1b [Felis catus]
MSDNGNAAATAVSVSLDP